MPRGRVLLLSLLLAGAAHADAVLLDRVAARVEDKVILVSDVRARMQPLVLRGETPDRAARETLEAMIDAVLVQRECKRLNLDVTADEIQRAGQLIMQQNGLDAAHLEAEIHKQGMTRAEWEAQIRDQLLEGKWLQTKLAGTPHPETDAAMGAWVQQSRAELVQKLRAASYVDVRL